MSTVDTALRTARRKVIREHIRQESTQDLEGLLAGMTKDCVCFTARSSSTQILHRPTVVPRLATPTPAAVAGFQTQRTQLLK